MTALPAPTQGDMVPGGRLRILHLEDNAPDRELIRAHLARLGFQLEVVHAKTRQDFEEALTQGKFDLILSDYTLPSYNGLAALSLVRERCPEVPFIFVSGTIGEERAVESMKSGAVDYVLKTHLDRLGAVVQRALRETREREERHRSEAALEQTQALLRMASRVIKMGAWQVELPDFAVTWSEEVRAIHEVSPDYTLNRDEIMRFYVPESQAVVREVFDACVREGTPYDVELELITAKGNRIWARSIGEAVRDLQGRIVRVQGAFQDITERKQAAAYLTAFSSLGEKLGVARAPKDVAVAVSEITDKWLGWDAFILDLWDPNQDRTETVLALDVIQGRRQEVHPASRTGMSPIMRRMMAEGAQLALREAGLEATRDLIPFGDVDRPAAAMMYVPVRIGAQAVGFLSIQSYTPGAYNRDKLKSLQTLADHSAGALARIYAEEQVREQARLLDMAPDAISVCDLEGRIVYWNRGAERLHGWTCQEISGQKVSEFLYADLAAYDKARQELLGTGNFQGELHQRTKRGEEVVVSCRWNLLRGAESQARAVLAINTDITDQKKLEAQSLRAQRLESIGTLASGVAHDLNNVLAPILMASQMLEAGPLDPASRKMLETVATNAERGAGIVKQLLTFVRGVEGEKTLLSPARIIKDLVKLLRQTFPKHLTIQSRIPPDLWSVNADATQLHQVLLNLCVNARDAMPSGGTLEITAENIQLDAPFVRMLPHAKIGPHVLFRVRDTGTGIPATLLERIFDPFFTTKEAGKGTGLGLSTVLGIVKGHGGFVLVDSQVGKGTIFSVYLPASPTAAATEAPTPDSDLLRGNGELILVVDDEPTVLDVTRSVLERYGYATATATDGVEALAVYSQQPGEVKLVLTDIAMPNMDGVVLTRVLRKMCPHLRLIASSGVTSGVDETNKTAELKALGVDRFLQKPYTTETLLCALHEVLRRGDSSSP